MKKLFILIGLSFFSVRILLSQPLHNNNWLLGYDTSAFTPFGGLILFDFKFDPVDISYVTSLNGFGAEGTNTIMSDQYGNLIFFTDGCLIANANHEIMKNGDNINPGNLHILFCGDGGNPMYQTAIAIPAPNSDSLFYLFSRDFEDINFPSHWTALAPQNLYSHTIDMSKDNNLGEVILKNNIVLKDTFSRSAISATKHSNGKDWWVVLPKFGSNCYFSVLITEDGIQTPHKICSGHIWDYQDKISYSTFSPDGKKYARSGLPHGLSLFDFDSSTGTLVNPIQIPFPNDSISATAGVAFSENSRFLYVTQKFRVYQFDMLADNIPASQVIVAEWDGFLNPSATIFNFAALAPNGKIYISSTSSHLSLHVIHNPDSSGFACNFEQHGVNLPSYNFVTLPNTPHYGKKNTSASPLIKISVSFSISPNPAQNLLLLQNRSDTPPKDLQIDFYDPLGKLHKSSPIRSSVAELDISDLEAGMYFYRIYRKADDAQFGAETIQTGKVLKVE